MRLPLQTSWQEVLELVRNACFISLSLLVLLVSLFKGTCVRPKQYKWMNFFIFFYSTQWISLLWFLTWFLFFLHKELLWWELHREIQVLDRANWVSFPYRSSIHAFGSLPEDTHPTPRLVRVQKWAASQGKRPSSLTFLVRQQRKKGDETHLEETHWCRIFWNMMLCMMEMIGKEIILQKIEGPMSDITMKIST